MRRLAAFIAAAVLAAPVLAQHEGHAPAPAEQPTEAPKTAPSPQPSDPHAGHGQPPQQQEPKPVAPAGPHEGHAAPSPAATTVEPPVAPAPAEARGGPEHAADSVYGAERMAPAREELRRGHGDLVTYKVLVDLLEAQWGDGGDRYVWEDVQFWYGDDIDKLWIKSQGEGAFGEDLEEAEVQALWSHAIGPWFDLQAGVRYDFRPKLERAHVVLGIQGLAPYFFEIDGALFLSDDGDLSARFEAEYDLRVTQQLILQPRAELDLAAQDVPEVGVGSGLSTAEIGLRLRHEFFPEDGPAVLAPYIGVQYERAFGDTADFRRLAGEDVGGWSFVAGLKTWF